MAVDFLSLFQQLKAGVTELAKNTAKDCVVAATSDGIGIINELKEQLQVWTHQMEKGKLTADDFQHNLQTSADLLEMVALKDEGLTMVKIDRFKGEVIDLISTTVKSIIP